MVSLLKLIRNHRTPYTLHAYVNEFGEFDYVAYKRSQTEANHRKINLVWAREDDIAWLASIINHRGEPKFGLCHGTRRGVEQAWFSKRLGCRVIGTEISDTATQLPSTVQWDFHNANPEWTGKANFVYSNALDHAYDPELALNTWMAQLNPLGVCVIEHSKWHSPKGASQTDPFGADLAIMPYLVLQWSRGKFSVREIHHRGDRQFMFIEHNRR
jgi:hypothetical protein